MSTLIIPAAGKSSRFHGMRPKWLLTMPDGSLMIERSLKGILENNKFDRIVISLLDEHVKNYTDINKLQKILNQTSLQDVELHILNTPTQSQSETVVKSINDNKINGPILIKDCDNYFEFIWNGKNQIATVHVNELNDSTISNKSFVEVNSVGIVQNIAEKKIISDTICCGGYGFESSTEFKKAYNSIKTDTELYVSHVVFQMIMNDSIFEISESNKYQDWGTASSYKKFMKKHLTIFCDIDGVLLENGNKFSSEGWRTSLISENIKAIKDLRKSHELYIVITTSRPESERPYLEKIFSENNIFINNYIMGIPHSKRVLINDFSNTNNYPTAIAINIERDVGNLSKLLNQFCD